MIVQEAFEKNIVLLELGVGFNTPAIIRHPFENITVNYPYAKLIRINITKETIPERLSEKTILLQDDIGEVLSDTLQQ